MCSKSQKKNKTYQCAVRHWCGLRVTGDAIPAATARIRAARRVLKVEQRSPCKRAYLRMAVSTAETVTFTDPFIEDAFMSLTFIVWLPGVMSVMPVNVWEPASVAVKA